MLDCSIAERLHRLDIPQQVFATLLGVTGGALSSYLSQQASPSAQTEAKIKSTLAELERLSALFPVLPNFRSVTRTQALLIAMRDGAFVEYERITAAVAAVGSSVGLRPQAEQVSRGEFSADRKPSADPHRPASARPPLLYTTKT